MLRSDVSTVATTSEPRSLRRPRTSIQHRGPLELHRRAGSPPTASSVTAAAARIKASALAPTSRKVRLTHTGSSSNAALPAVATVVAANSSIRPAPLTARLSAELRDLRPGIAACRSPAMGNHLVMSISSWCGTV